MNEIKKVLVPFEEYAKYDLDGDFWLYQRICNKFSLKRLAFYWKPHALGVPYLGILVVREYIMYIYMFVA